MAQLARGGFIIQRRLMDPATNQLKEWTTGFVPVWVDPNDPKLSIERSLLSTIRDPSKGVEVHDTTPGLDFDQGNSVFQWAGHVNDTFPQFQQAVTTLLGAGNYETVVCTCVTAETWRPRGGPWTRLPSPSCPWTSGPSS